MLVTLQVKVGTSEVLPSLPRNHVLPIQLQSSATEASNFWGLLGSIDYILTTNWAPFRGCPYSKSPAIWDLCLFTLGTVWVESNEQQLPLNTSAPALWNDGDACLDHLESLTHRPRLFEHCMRNGILCSQLFRSWRHIADFDPGSTSSESRPSGDFLAY